MQFTIGNFEYMLWKKSWFHQMIRLSIWNQINFKNKRYILILSIDIKVLCSMKIPIFITTGISWLSENKYKTLFYINLVLYKRAQQQLGPNQSNIVFTKIAQPVKFGAAINFIEMFPNILDARSWKYHQISIMSVYWQPRPPHRTKNQGISIESTTSLIIDIII